MIYIYVKRLPNGLLYLGKTECENPYLYKGSGNAWLKCIKENKYKIQDIETWILHKTEDKKEVVKLGIYYSKLFDVVKSDNWANLKEEEGDGGSTNKDRVVINNGLQHKFIQKEDVQYYLSLGWKLGYTEQHNRKVKVSKQVNGSTEEAIKKMVKTRKESNSFSTAAKKAVKTKKETGAFDQAIIKMVETKKRNGTASIGAKKAHQTKINLGIPNGMQGKKHSPETIKKLKRNLSESHKQKLKKPKPKKECELCKKMTDYANLKRWHGKGKCE